ncbi:MAG: dTDP-4-dehydrorhamnose reductase [Pseudanabaenaceae cyanobacterium]
MKLLVTGISGQVGWELQRTLLPLGEVIPCDRAALDLTQPDQIPAVLQEIRPDVVLNPAAYTAVDRAESEPALAETVNAIAPGVLAEACRAVGALLVHYSTDYVFDGTGDRPYREDDAPNPLNVYGRTKLAGEQAIQAVGGDYLILRTSWVYGLRGQNFCRKMLALARERSHLRIVADQIGAPTWSRAIAELTAQIVAQNPRDRSGVYHLTAAGHTSWYGFAKAILALDPEANHHKVTVVEPIPSSAYPTPAQRPANSRLDNTKLYIHFGLALPAWEVGLALALDNHHNRKALVE